MDGFTKKPTIYVIPAHQHMTSCKLSRIKMTKLNKNNCKAKFEDSSLSNVKMMSDK